MAPRAVLTEGIALYGGSYDQPVDLCSAGGVDVARRVAEGERVDIVVLATDSINALIHDGRLRPEQRVDLMMSEIAVAVRTGTPYPRITNERAVQKTVIEAASIGYSSGPSGKHLERLFARWQLFDTLRKRIVVAPPGVSVASLVAAGTVELGFQQLSELLNIAQVEVVGPLPQGIQHTTKFTGGVAVGCNQVEAATGLLEFLSSLRLRSVRRRHGMSDVPARPG